MLTTASRSRLRSAALAALRDQVDVPRFELIVVTDDDDPVTARQITQAISYTAVKVTVYKRAAWRSLSEKRNVACAFARGDWLTFWDDDDWSAPTRLRGTADTIEAYKDAEMIGVRQMLWHELVGPTRHTIEYVAPVPGYVVGGTLTFRSRVLQQHPFENIAGDEGWWTLKRHEEGRVLVPIWFPYVAMIHGGNTANPRNFRVNEQTGQVHDGIEFTLRHGGREVVREIMGDDALARFEAAVA